MNDNSHENLERLTLTEMEEFVATSRARDLVAVEPGSVYRLSSGC